ncbi:hypothetical protein RAS12_06980 [Achromobacter seleniivolatilans]|uniref:Uncharacterized protein n=1 Tax=Achromobacter seleniivolatilans TaxID=3047478 RepID=A0ABY9M8J4_9BURK|nr:hypothetical protein [Achromobacter sp. R39]WMD22112.1 hypothetical protein RAS12_06980 [Achromobacter sp. R39]
MDAVNVSVHRVPLRQTAGGPSTMYVQSDGVGGVYVSFADGTTEWGTTQTLSEEPYEALRQEIFRKELADLKKVPSYRELYPLEGEHDGGSTTPNGNTLGRAAGDAAAGGDSAEASNPQVEAETDAESESGNGVLDGIQTGLDIVGLIPVAGEAADLVNAGISLARGDYAGAALSLASAIPFVGWLGTAGKVGRRAAGAASAAKKAEKAGEAAADAGKAAGKGGKEGAGQGAKHGDDAVSGKGNGKGKDKDGGKSKGEDRDCTLRTYGRGCPPGRTPHHIVPDRVFKLPSKVRLKGGLSHGKGLCICVAGGTPVRKGPRVNEHGSIHAIYDPAEAALGAQGNPLGTSELGKLEGLGVTAAAAVTGCNPVTMAAKVRAYHQSQGLSATDLFRADPTGRMLNPAEFPNLGKGSSKSGLNGL